MGKPVVYAQLRDVFFIPGMKNGNFGPTLPPASQSLTNFKMTLQDSGDILMEWTEGNFNCAYTVSQSNIKGCKHPATPVATAKATAPVAATVASPGQSVVTPAPVGAATTVPISG